MNKKSHLLAVSVLAMVTLLISSVKSPAPILPSSWWFGTNVQNKGSASDVRFTIGALGITDAAPAVLYTTPPPIIFVATNGSDSGTGLTLTNAFLTPRKAAQYAQTLIQSGSNSVTIYLSRGFYNLGTNQIILTNNVHLIGEGYAVTELFGYADCAGPEAGFYATGGPQINPGNNSVLRGFTMTCDTNSIITAVPGTGHSGTWAGIGVSFLNSPADKSFTNVLLSGVRIRKGWFDCFHVNSQNRVTATLENCILETEGVAVNNQAASVPDPHTFIHLQNVTGKSGGIFPQSIIDAAGYWTPGFINTENMVVAENCTFEVETNATDIAHVNPGNMFQLTSGASLASVHVIGGVYRNKNIPDEGDFLTPANVYGWCNYNRTNTSKPISVSSYAAGTAYPLTSTPALLNFGTTDPVITIPLSGTYRLDANVGLKYNGATFVANQTATVKLRKTSGSAADVSNASRTITLSIITTVTSGVETVQIPPVYFTANPGDVIQLFGSVSVAPSAGSVDAVSAEIIAQRIP